MKRTIEIVSSFTGTIPTGNYENEKPFYSLKETFETEDEIADLDTYVMGRQKKLHDYCYNQFQKQAESANIERIQREYMNIRFYPVGDIKYPSVTSIINWDADFNIPADELAQYASRGTIIDKQVQIFLENGLWKEPKEIPEIYPDLVIVKQGNLGLALDDVDFRAFYESYPFKVIECQKVHTNDEHRYAGRSDIKCVIESSNKGKWADVLFDVPTILDVKSGQIDKVKHMKQQTAYAKCDPDVKQVGLIHLNKETKQGFSKPIMEQDLDKYWSLFLADRDKFKKRYGV